MSELDSAATQHIANSTGVETWQGNPLAGSFSYYAAPVEAWLPRAHICREVEQLDQSTSDQGVSQQQYNLGLKNTLQRHRVCVSPKKRCHN